jgi:dTDP-4-dehydrorhamnose reductase
VINAAGFSSIEAAEAETFRCHRENTKGPAVLASACQELGLPLVLFSSADVFDGKKLPGLYKESDVPHPLNVYGRSKAAMEKIVLRQMPTGALIVRCGALFGPWDGTNFLTAALRQIAQGLPVQVSDDVITSSYLPDFGHAVLDLLIDGADGIWHLGHPEAIPRSEMVRHAARLAGLDERLVQRLNRLQSPSGAQRPEWAGLTSERTRPLLPPLEQALHHFVSCGFYEPNDAAQNKPDRLETEAGDRVLAFV